MDQEESSSKTLNAQAKTLQWITVNAQVNQVNIVHALVKALQ